MEICIHYICITIFVILSFFPIIDFAITEVKNVICYWGLRNIEVCYLKGPFNSQLVAACKLVFLILLCYNNICVTGNNLLVIILAHCLLN